MAASNFKVIVVGGGPVGLTAAHALDRASIDFVLLESRPHVVLDAGSNLVMSPAGLRTLAQLGLFDALKNVSSPLGRIDRLDHQGRNMGDLQIFTELEKNFGIAPRCISRHDLTRVLYDGLSSAAQARILPNKKLSAVALETTANGVTATCADGSSYQGSIIVGADGAHSIVRKLMREMAINSGSSTTDVNEEQPFLTTYRGLWVRFPRAQDLPVGTSCEAHGRNLATQLFAGEETGVLGVYERLDEPTKERQRFTAADQDALVERWGHITVAPNRQTLRDVYNARLESGLVSLEEGTVQHWSHAGRVVLVGDAAHKFTPSTGAGCMNGISDIVSLVNELHSTIGESGTGEPSSEALAAAFHAYQAQRYAKVEAEGQTSGQATATATWQNGIFKFVDQRIMSIHAVQRRLIRSGATKVARMPTFNFLGGEEHFVGRVPWVTAA